jgi:hypothetical protein
LFEIYDTDGSGELDYKEFIAALFNNMSASTRMNSPAKDQVYAPEKKNRGGFKGYKNDEEVKENSNKKPQTNPFSQSEEQ